ncbi:hypothetical protein HYALB_00012224 [Hymenoscyphus albidus]|uniref:Uncharacterized protein n=1 Tax=Hymenoscyphus albidus TaxID=595503 RepID=A0A9N9LW49_9HELO|nr:hypothetical protein HYALB_00012224 [Hymenoscyphus albidus]
MNNSGRGPRFDFGAGIQSGSMWTSHKEKKSSHPEKKHSNPRNDSSASLSQQPTTTEFKHGSGTTVSTQHTQPSSMYSAAPTNYSGPYTIPHPCPTPGPISEVDQRRRWTVQRWQPEHWPRRDPWEAWTDSGNLYSPGHMFNMQHTISMEDEIEKYAHHKPSRMEVSEMNMPFYIDRTDHWDEEEAEKLFKQLLRTKYWKVTSGNAKSYRLTENLNDAAIKQIRELEVNLTHRDEDPMTHDLERLLVNPRTRLTNAPLERLWIHGRLGDPIIYSVAQRFIQCGCPITDLRVRVYAPPTEGKVKIYDPRTRILHGLADSIGELFAQRFAWGAGPEMWRSKLDNERLQWTIRKHPKPIEPVTAV